MIDTDEKLLPPREEPPRIEAPAEERLLAEIEALRRELEELKKKNGGRNDSRAPRPRGRTLWLIGAGLLALLILAALLGWLPRHLRAKELANESRQEQQALPQVKFIRAQTSAPTDELILPGTTEAITDAPILARADGYVSQRFVDIGDHVKKGQIMAIIGAPDVDQQVVQARAQVAQAQSALKQADANLQQGKANEELARVTAARYDHLVTRGAVARQDNDTQQANYQAQVSNVAALAEAESAASQNVESARANLRRLIELQGFERVTAPFEGVVTLRNIDVGTLIGTGATLLFRVAQVDRLRTYVNVPQPNAPSVAVGEEARVEAAEFGDHDFSGRVTRTAEALDPTTRTLVTEVQVPNPEGKLRPGMFVDVKLRIQRASQPILVPGDSLIVDAKGAQIGVLRDVKRAQILKNKDNSGRPKATTVEGTVHLQNVSLGRDYGAATEIVSGLSQGDLVVVNPNDSVREGVRAQATETQAILDVESGSAAQQKQNANSEKLQKQAGAEPPAKRPSEMKKKRGPGF